MVGKREIIDNLIENIDEMLNIIEENEVIDEDFTGVLEAAAQLREEIAGLIE